jgi:hypothetical protein
MTKLNLVLWIVSVALQCILLAALLMRGLIGRLPIFTILIGFYVLRSTALYAVSSHLGARTSALMLSGLAVIDIVLQVAVAWELLYAAANPNNAAVISIDTARGALLRCVGKFSLLLIAAATLAVVISNQIHANPRAPMDRGILFTSTLFLLVFLVSLSPQTPALDRRIAGGFALHSGVSILCQIGRTLAAVRRDVIAFNRWSYVEVVAYLTAVLIFVVVCQEKHNPIHDDGDDSCGRLSSVTT